MIPKRRQKYVLDNDDVIREGFFSPANADTVLAGLSKNGTQPLAASVGGTGNAAFTNGRLVYYDNNRKAFVSSAIAGRAGEGSLGSIPIISETAPDASADLWLYTVSGSPVRLYKRANNLWLSKHPLFPGMIVMYPNSVTNIAYMDGGSVGSVTETSGPFWKVSTAVGLPAGTIHFIERTARIYYAVPVPGMPPN